MVFVFDPCGIICLVVAYGAILYADYVVVRWIIMQTMAMSLWAPLHVIGFNSIIFMLGMAHMKAVFCDPGTVPLLANRIDLSNGFNSPSKANGNSSGRSEWTVCTRCEAYRPPRAHHCRICNRCIRRMDHHCPWINNCVGERNQKYFLQFLVYVGVLSVYAVGLIIYSWVYPCDQCERNIIETQTRMVHSVMLLLEAALFGLFVLAIMFDQLHAILYDETAIEAIQQKASYRPSRRKYQLLADVFGRGHPLFWLLPCTGLNHGARYQDTPLLSYEV